MKAIFLTFGILLSAQSVFAVPCSQPIEGRPCRPDERDEKERTLTKNAKQEILDLIKLAIDADPDVQTLKAKYLEIQNNPDMSAEKKDAVFHPFFLAQMEQIALYNQAIIAKVIGKYRKHLVKEKREHDKRWGTGGPVQTPSTNERGGRSRPPDGDDRNDRIWDPGCGCWIRRQ